MLHYEACMDIRSKRQNRTSSTIPPSLCSQEQTKHSLVLSFSSNVLLLALLLLLVQASRLAGLISPKAVSFLCPLRVHALATSVSVTPFSCSAKSFNGKRRRLPCTCFCKNRFTDGLESPSIRCVYIYIYIKHNE